MNAHTHHRLQLEHLESRRLLAVEVMLNGGEEGLYLPSTNLTDVEKVDICGCGNNVVTLDAEWIDNSGVDGMVKVVANTGDRIDLMDTGWKFARAQAEGEEIIREFHNKNVVLHLVGPDDWTNPINKNDVNGDEEVTSLDVLVITNELVQRRFSNPKDGTINDVAAIPFDQFKFYDVTGDHKVTTLDALCVMNQRRIEYKAEEVAAIAGATASVPTVDAVLPLQLLASDPVIAERVYARETSSDVDRTESKLVGSHFESTSVPSVPRIQSGQRQTTQSSDEAPSPLNASLVDSLMLDPTLGLCLETDLCVG